MSSVEASHAEVTSMRTTPARKRGGIASLMLEHIITEARRMGFTRSRGLFVGVANKWVGSAA